MKSPNRFHTRVMALTVATLISVPASVFGAHNYDHDSVTYVTGGIGDDERNALEMARHQYNLHITNADRNGAFVSDADLAIYDRAGNQVLNTESGPLFYAELPPGKYTIAAKNEGNQQRKSITVSHDSPSNVTFIWN